jgi:hypothetical protein
MWIWNESLDTFANCIVWLNILGAAVAAVVNFHASHVNPAPWSRIRLMIAAYATIYVGGYLWLLNVDDIAVWSQTMRGVSVLTWPLVWIAPAWVSTRVWREVKQQITDSEEP